MAAVIEHGALARGHRDRGGWTPAALAYIDPVREVLTSLHGYWPVTLRQVYYQRVAAGHIANTPGEGSVRKTKVSSYIT